MLSIFCSEIFSLVVNIVLSSFVLPNMYTVYVCYICFWPAFVTQLHSDNSLSLRLTILPLFNPSIGSSVMSFCQHHDDVFDAKSHQKTTNITHPVQHFKCHFECEKAEVLRQKSTQTDIILFSITTTKTMKIFLCSFVCLHLIRISFIFIQNTRI